MPVIDSPEFGHAFVPIDSLTGSPMSSTGSTSVLEWNSNSGSEGFSVHSLGHEQYVLSSPSTPDIPTFSPNPLFPETSPPDHPQLFESFNSAAPVITDSGTTTVTSDTSVDEYHNLISALEERLSLQDSVNQWQHHSYHESAGLDGPVERFDDVAYDKPPNTLAPSSNRSVVTDSSITAKPSVHVSSLFLPPPTPPTPHIYSESPSVASGNNQSEGISIAQYFQLKAAKVPELVQPPVDAPLRPISAASCLSYASSVQSPVAAPLPDRGAQAPLLHETWHDSISKVDDSSTTTAYPPPIRPLRCYSSHPSWYQPTYSPNLGPPTPWNCFTGLHSSPSKKPQMGNNNTDSPFIGKVTVPSPQAADTLKSYSKSYAPSRPGWPIPPAISCQFEPATLKPIKPIIPNSPRVTFSYGTLHGKVPGKPTIHPVPPASQASGSPAPTIHWRSSDFSRPNPWSHESRIRDVRQASPESTDSVLPPPPSTPSVSSPPRPGSPRSSRSASAVPPSPPSPPLVDLQPPYSHHAPPSNVPYIPLTPVPASPLNDGYTCAQRTSRALPIPRTFGSHTQTPFTPRYTGSTLPRDMHLSAAPPTPWGPTPRKLRFAPLPPTPSFGLPYTSAPGYPYITPSYTTPLPSYPSYPMAYPYHTPGPAPHIPVPTSTSAPYSSWRSEPTNSSPLYAPHPVFWYSDGSIVFHVENVGYKVHRHFFERHSTYFRDSLAYPAYAATPLPIRTIFLPDVKKVDFERLLLIFYPSHPGESQLFIAEEWTSILILSEKWNFAQLKALAIRELGFNTSTIEKIALSKKYNVGNPQWLLAAYRELCTRRHPLSLGEGENLGLETVIKIWETQHELMMGSTWGRSVDTVIQEKFGLV